MSAVMGMNAPVGVDGGAGRRRTLTRWLVGAVLAVMVAAGASLFWSHLRRSDPFPVQAVRLEGDLAHVADADLRAAVAPHLGDGLLFVDLDAIRDAVTALPWVASAAVWRVWPTGLRIRVQEHEPIAAWGERGVLSAKGERFTPPQRPEGLPQLGGPAGSASLVWARFEQLREALGELGRPVALTLDKRRAWVARLDNGMRLRFGRDDFDERLQRLLAAWPAVQRRAGDRAIAAVDLRYPNGLAVEWGPPASEPTTGGDSKR
ncbi:cell division protein FtsQ/DivIB [Arhodomonas aquaeolei]|uniref:cell division protein FtsQ/DivIB n=1 Tax=Arhodomonas aquaeolei TaxID=2369 RepID=UPI002167A4B8|nr:cell division protein FtsQ/DivIB [Arhodomonas aquaeolei]MCS4504700.1 cell division protein FtsQ/DivIB [Arhodomonas aquaeolei]